MEMLQIGFSCLVGKGKWHMVAIVIGNNRKCLPGQY